MHWIAGSLVSALFLGIYDLFIKHAVHNNAVVPVLFFSNLTASVVWLALMAAHAIAPPGAVPSMFVVDALTWTQHAQLVLKSFIVALSWMCSYFAVKHLPVSIGSPIRATGPIWVLLGALVVLGERPTWLEMLGIATTLVSFAALSVVGRGEGVHFHRDKWVAFMIAGTILGAISGLYDKYLLGTLHFTASTVQAWFTFYLGLFFVPLAIGWKRRWWPRNEFHWRWSIPSIALALLVADFVYFAALREPGSLVSIVSSMRRGSTLVAFAGGLLIYREANGLKKLPAVLGLLAGIVLTVLG